MNLWVLSIWQPEGLFCTEEGPRTKCALWVSPPKWCAWKFAKNLPTVLRYTRLNWADGNRLIYLRWRDRSPRDGSLAKIAGLSISGPESKDFGSF